MAGNEGAERFAHVMGVAVLDLWSDLPQEIQQRLFERMAGHYTMVGRAVSVAYAESVDTLAADMMDVHPTIVCAVAPSTSCS